MGITMVGVTADHRRLCRRDFCLASQVGNGDGGAFPVTPSLFRRVTSGPLSCSLGYSAQFTVRVAFASSDAGVTFSCPIGSFACEP